MARAAKKGANATKRAAPKRAAPRGSARASVAKRTVTKVVAAAKAVRKKTPPPPAKTAGKKAAPKVAAAKKKSTKAQASKTRSPTSRAPESKAVTSEPRKPEAPKPQPPKPEAPKPEPPKKPRKPEVSPKTIQKIKGSLEAQRVALLREFTDLEEGAFSLSQSDMSGEASFDEEYADAGSFTFEREKELSIGNNIRDLLEKVTHALDRIERGTYGLCENCGDPINKDRLMALPYSSLCIRCKQQEERTR